MAIVRQGASSAVEATMEIRTCDVAYTPKVPSRGGTIIDLAYPTISNKNPICIGKSRISARAHFLKGAPTLLEINERQRFGQTF